MNGTTRCPHCETRFKIVEAQLNAHQGMVRCGSCLQAFDARLEFMGESAESAPQIDLSISPEPQPESFDELQTHAQPDKIESNEPSEQVEEITVQAAALVEIEPLSAPDEKTDINFFLKTESVDTLDFSQLPDTPSPSHEAVTPEAALACLTLAENDSPLELADEVTIPPPNRARWPWIAGCCLLTTLLMAQAVYFLRVGIATNLPALKPALVGCCNLIGCQVPLPRHAESISIESSGLEADPEHENIITLSALLRNRASYALEFPVLALTLNDNQDKTLARRLLMPADYLPATENKLAGFPASHEVSIRLNLNTADLKPLGYRLELFYN